MAKNKKERQKWSKKKKAKLIFWLIIIILVAFGFAHQYYIHTDSYIKSFYEDNKTLLTQAAQQLLEKPTDSQDLNISSDEQQIQKDGKINIGFLKDNPYYKEISSILYDIEDIGIQDIKATSESVRFYASARYVLIYSPNVDEVSGAEKIGDGWFYIDTF